jgi:hypothetical protein
LHSVEPLEHCSVPFPLRFGSVSSVSAGWSIASQHGSCFESGEWRRLARGGEMTEQMAYNYDTFVRAMEEEKIGSKLAPVINPANRSIE